MHSTGPEYGAGRKGQVYLRDLVVGDRTHFGGLGVGEPGLSFQYVRRCAQTEVELALFGGKVACGHHGSCLGGQDPLPVCLELVSGAEQATEEIEREATSLEQSLGLRILVKRTEAPGTRQSPGALAYRLAASSLDHPGIVQRISHLLAEQGVNIEMAECQSRPGPWSPSAPPEAGKPLNL